ncbi:MAG: membrane dipeptidase [Acidobacteria bacterium]|nr:membrane dipeptidase [Acidobacteriota bacterium]
MENSEFLAFDLHVDTLQRVLDENVDLTIKSENGHLDIPRMHQGGIGVQFFSIWVNPKQFPKEKAVDRSWRLIDALKKQTFEHPDKIALVTCADDVKKTLKKGQIAAGMGIEGGHSINGRIELLEAFFQAGVRYMTLTWSNSNEICGSSGDEGRSQGLTVFGKDVVKLMNKLGMMVDISHVSDKAFYDVLELSTQPLIASHSNLRRICSHPRNLTDDMLRDLAKAGGVCCINFYPAFLDDEYYKVNFNLGARLSEALSQVRKIYAHNPHKRAQAEGEVCAREFGRLPKVSYKKVVDHIQQAVEIAGIDHVGLGSDYDGIGAVPVGLEDISKLQIIAKELLERGFDSDSIKKIFFGNVMRVFSAVCKPLEE